MAFGQGIVNKSGGNGAHEREKVLYFQSRSVLRGAISPFYLGNTLIDRAEAARIVRRYQKMNSAITSGGKIVEKIGDGEIFAAIREAWGKAMLKPEPERARK